MIIFDIAIATGLFSENDIKARINSYKYYLVGLTTDDFIHIFCSIIQGRIIDQKSDLSKSIISKLKPMFPSVQIISINIRNFTKATYYNKIMI